MTREEAIRIIKIVLAVADDFEIIVQGEEFTEEKCKEAVDMAIQALEQEPCGDAISRQAVIDIIEDVCPIYGNDYRYILRERVNDLPLVTPAEKVGLWIPVSEGLPEKDGDYLVTVKGMRNYIKCCYFALNLYKVDKYDFENKKGVAGFYGCDSEYGCYEMTEVIAWCELPEPYKASPTGAESENKNEP